MNDVLQLAVDAHGALDRWNALTSVDTDLSLTGAIWSEKGRPDVFRQANLKAQLHTEHIIVSPVSGAGRRSVLNGKQQVLDGEVAVVGSADQLFGLRDVVCARAP